jgi:tRNA(Arg) A34 adenosine deaminase TadA
MTTYPQIHDPFIRQCHKLALSAAGRGNHPYGALLVHEGQVILTAQGAVRLRAAENCVSD